MATAPFLCLVWALTDPPPGVGLPGFPTHPIAPGGPYPDQGLPGQGGGQPSHPWVPPGQGGGGQPSHPWVPPGSGGQPSHPIYHPGHPDHGLPAHPEHPISGGGGSGSGGQPSHPIHIPGVPDQGLPEGQPIPDNELPPIEVPPEYEDDLVIGVKQPGSTEWTFTAYDVQPDQGQPSPTPHQ